MLNTPFLQKFMRENIARGTKTYYICSVKIEK